MARKAGGPVVPPGHNRHLSGRSAESVEYAGHAKQLALDAPGDVA